MRTCVNLHSAEIKFAVGTASFLREGLDFPHKKPFTKPRRRSISIGRIEPRLPVPDIPYRGSEPRWRRPLRRGSQCAVGCAELICAAPPARSCGCGSGGLASAGGGGSGALGAGGSFGSGIGGSSAGGGGGSSTGGGGLSAGGGGVAGSTGPALTPGTSFASQGNPGFTPSVPLAHAPGPIGPRKSQSRLARLVATRGQVRPKNEGSKAWTPKRKL